LCVTIRPSLLIERLARPKKKFKSRREMSLGGKDQLQSMYFDLQYSGEDEIFEEVANAIYPTAAKIGSQI
jgi:hypothetical protein